jgi:hypothetical protein
MLLNARQNQFIFGAGKKGNITSLQYADDTLVVYSADPVMASRLKEILKVFQWISGLKINFQKSNLIYTGSSQTNKNEIARILQCSIADPPSQKPQHAVLAGPYALAPQTGPDLAIAFSGKHRRGQQLPDHRHQFGIRVNVRAALVRFPRMELTLPRRVKTGSR